jgi:hypothetical protein
MEHGLVYKDLKVSFFSKQALRRCSCPKILLQNKSCVDDL